MKVFRFSLALSACLLLIAPVVFGQTTGEIMGTVTGTDGRPLPGVTVEASSASLQGTRVSVTGNDGMYRFISLPPGTYKVRGSLSGFTTVERAATVKLDSAVTIPIQLQVSAKEELVVTGEAPVVDSTSAEDGLNIRQSVAQKLPVGRNYSSVVAIQPGVATDQSETQGRGGSTNPTGGGFTIYGATSIENSYLVDGVNTTNVIKGFQGKALAQEFIEEVQVKSSGYEAEYGRATGGVINVVTKSGGNDFHGDAFGYFGTKGLTADYKGTADIVYNDAHTNFENFGTDASNFVDRSQQDRQDYGADLGGFFMKDHIWFFGAYNRVTYDNSQFYNIGTVPIYGPLVAGVDQPFDSTANIYSGKMTFRLGQGTTLVGTVFGDPETRTGLLANLTSTNPIIKNATRELGAVDYSGAITQLFGSSALITGRYAKHQDRYQLLPGPGSDAPQILDSTSGATIVSNGFGEIFGPTVFNKSTRDAYQLTGTFYAANHEIKVGGDYEDMTTFTTSFYTGGTRLLIESCGAPGSDTECAAGAPLLNGKPVFYGHDFYTDSTDDPTSAFLPAGNVANPTAIRYSAFIQDKWTVIPSLTVSLGVRWDQEDIRDYTNQTVILLKNEWQPRIGIAWDVAGDGSSKLAASAGRFYFAMPTDMNVRAYGAQTIATTYNYSSDFNNIIQDPTAPLELEIQGGPFTEPVQGFVTGCVLGGSDTAPPCVSSLKGIYQDEYTLGFDKAIDPTFAIGVKGTYRHYGRTIEDRCDADTAYPEANSSSCVIINPGSDDAFSTGDFHGCAGFAGVPFDNSGSPDTNCTSQALTPISQPLPPGGVYNTAIPKAKREYWAVEMVAKKQMGRSLWAQGSFIWSQLRGNYDGAARQTNQGQTDPGINADFDYPAFLNNADGKLYLDRPFAFRLDTAYTAPFGLTLGFSGFVRSGAPQDQVLFFNNQYGAELLAEPRGSFGRLPTDYEISASMGYTIKIAPVDITLFLQGFNLLNRQTVIQVDGDYTQRAPGSPQEFNGNFDHALARRDPRKLTFGARVSF